MNKRIRQILSADYVLSALTLSLVFSFSAFADSGFDSCASSPNDPQCRFNPQGASAGPLSKAAGERARQGQSEIGNFNSTGASEIQASSLGVCGTAKCSPAQRAAAIANATATRTAATAASRMVQELSARQEIVKQVDSGVGSRYTAAEASAFHEMFQSSTLPTQDQIDSLHPDLRDPATAMRTSVGSEKFLSNAMEKNRDLAKKTSELVTKNTDLLDRAKSFSESGSAKLELGSQYEKSVNAERKIAEDLPVKKSRSIGRPKKDFRTDDIGKIGSPGKELKPVSDEDKTLIGQLIVGLRDGLDLDKAAAANQEGKTGAGEGGQADVVAVGDSKGSEAKRGLASVEGKASGSEDGRNGVNGQAGAGGAVAENSSAENFSNAGNGIVSERDLAAIDLSIFQRVHLRIAFRALKDGLVEPGQRK